jgi:hypothetical protein
MQSVARMTIDAPKKKGPVTSRACKGHPAAKAKGQLDVTEG